MAFYKSFGELMNAINFKHSIIFFNLCILLSPLNAMFSVELTVLCLFLILTIGISHGSLDNIKGRKLLKVFGLKSEYIFYLTYLGISSIIILLWLFLPNIVLLFFLIVACFHFGKEDTVFYVKKKIFYGEFLFFLKGSSVIIAPLLFHRDETNEIFRTLNFNVFENVIFSNYFLTIILFLSFLSNIYLTYKKDVNFKALMMMDFLIYFSVVLKTLLEVAKQRKYY